jgi:hypothetical protein
VLSRDLLRDAVEVVVARRSQMAGPVEIQRGARVGFATAAQLTIALADAGVLGEIGTGLRRPVLARDAYWGHRLVTEAISDGRISLDVAEDSMRLCGCRWERRDGRVAFTRRCTKHTAMCRSLEAWELELTDSGSSPTREGDAR